MKKILTGCLVVFVIALIGFGVAGFYAYRIARPMFDNAGDYVARARELARLGDRVTNQKPFVPPANGELTAGQVDRFLAVQGRVRNELGDRWEIIEAKSAEIRKKTEGNEMLGVAEVTAIFSDIANIYVEARREQVNALNIHKFSDGEYTWVKRRVYEAAGIHVASGFDFSAIENLARGGTKLADRRLQDFPLPEVPETNMRLVKPHAGKLKEWIPMAVLGL
jgi:hypothetical protein